MTKRVAKYRTLIDNSRLANICELMIAQGYPWDTKRHGPFEKTKTVVYCPDCDCKLIKMTCPKCNETFA